MAQGLMSVLYIILYITCYYFTLSMGKHETMNRAIGLCLWLGACLPIGRGLRLFIVSCYSVQGPALGETGQGLGRGLRLPADPMGEATGDRAGPWASPQALGETRQAIGRGLRLFIVSCFHEHIC